MAGKRTLHTTTVCLFSVRAAHSSHPETWAGQGKALKSRGTLDQGMRKLGAITLALLLAALLSAPRQGMAIGQGVINALTAGGSGACCRTRDMADPPLASEQAAMSCRGAEMQTAHMGCCTPMPEPRPVAPKESCGHAGCPCFHAAPPADEAAGAGFRFQWPAPGLTLLPAHPGDQFRAGAVSSLLERRRAPPSLPLYILLQSYRC